VDCPGQLLAWLQLSRYCLSAVAQNDLQAMLPLVATLLPATWQSYTDWLSICNKLLCQCRYCSGSRSSAAEHPASDGLARSSQPSQQLSTCQHQQSQQQQQQHVGPAVAAVLHELLQGLAPAWQCHQAIIRQRFEQRQLYLTSPEADLDGFMCSPANVMCSPANVMCSPAPWDGAGVPDANSRRALEAELQGHMKWMVGLLNLGRLLYGGAAFSAGCGVMGPSEGGLMTRCAGDAASERRLRGLWAEALQAVVGVTTAPLTRVSSRSWAAACWHQAMGACDLHLAASLLNCTSICPSHWCSLHKPEVNQTVMKTTGLCVLHMMLGACCLLLTLQRCRLLHVVHIVRLTEHVPAATGCLSGCAQCCC
jgi:hypothetical protein